MKLPTPESATEVMLHGFHPPANGQAWPGWKRARIRTSEHHLVDGVDESFAALCVGTASGKGNQESWGLRLHAPLEGYARAVGALQRNHARRRMSRPVPPAAAMPDPRDCLPLGTSTVLLLANAIVWYVVAMAVGAAPPGDGPGRGNALS